MANLSTIPDEQIPKTEIRRLSVPLYGCDTFGKLFAPRQLLTIITLAKLVRLANEQLEQWHDKDYLLAISQYLATIFDRVLDRASTASIWHTTREKVEGAVGRHTLPMTWDFAETNPVSGGSGNIAGAIKWVVKAIESAASFINGFGSRSPWHGSTITDYGS